MDFVSGHCRCWSMQSQEHGLKELLETVLSEIEEKQPSVPRPKRPKFFVVSTGTPSTTCKKCLSGLDPEDSICRTSAAQPGRLAQIGVVPGGNQDFGAISYKPFANQGCLHYFRYQNGRAHVD